MRPFGRPRRPAHAAWPSKLCRKAVSMTVVIDASPAMLARETRGVRLAARCPYSRAYHHLAIAIERNWLALYYSRRPTAALYVTPRLNRHQRRFVSAGISGQYASRQAGNFASRKCAHLRRLATYIIAAHALGQWRHAACGALHRKQWWRRVTLGGNAAHAPPSASAVKMASARAAYCGPSRSRAKFGLPGAAAMARLLKLTSW